MPRVQQLKYIRVKEKSHIILWHVRNAKKIKNNNKNYTIKHITWQRMAAQAALLGHHSIVLNVSVIHGFCDAMEL